MATDIGMLVNLEAIWGLMLEIKCSPIYGEGGTSFSHVFKFGVYIGIPYQKVKLKFKLKFKFDNLVFIYHQTFWNTITFPNYDLRTRKDSPFCQQLFSSINKYKNKCPSFSVCQGHGTHPGSYKGDDW